ncbi:MAG: hypothetical protein WDM90_01225 [Ferruginibacter sp.]
MKHQWNENLEKTNITSTTLLKGISKHDNEGAALIYTNVYDADFLAYFGDNDLDMYPDKKRDEIDRLIFARKEEFKKRKPLYMKQQLQSQYSNVVSYDNFTLITDGRTFTKQELKYTEKFILGDLTRKAGKNYLVNVPLLMGGQYQVKPKTGKGYMMWMFAIRIHWAGILVTPFLLALL